MESALLQAQGKCVDGGGGALALAIGLFEREEATLGQAAQAAGLSQAAFLRELGRRRIPIHYGSEELEADLRAIGSMIER